jgi:hypothetical protein
MITSRRIKQAGYIARMACMRKTYSILEENPKRWERFGELGIDGRLRYNRS